MSRDPEGGSKEGNINITEADNINSKYEYFV